MEFECFFFSYLTKKRGDDWVRRLKTTSIIVKGDISIECGKLKGTIGDGHDLSRVENLANIVERRSHESP